MSRFTIPTAAIAALIGVQLLATPAHAERAIQVTNGTDGAFWVMPYSRDDVGQSVTFGATSFQILPGQTSTVACATDSCDLLLDRSGGNAPAFRNVRADCINVTTYSQSRGIAAYASCGD